MCVGLLLGRSTPRIRGMVVPRSALALLVARVLADHQQLAVPADQLALLADTLDARSHFHRRLRVAPSGPEIMEITRVAVARKSGKGSFAGPSHRVFLLIVASGGRKPLLGRARGVYAPPLARDQPKASGLPQVE